MTLVELPGGFVLPLEWVIGIVTGFIVLIALVALLFLLYLKKDTSGPDEEDLVALPVVDEHGTIQEGPLLGNVERTQDELLVPIPHWRDAENNEITVTLGVDISQKIPLPLRDGTGRLKRIWIGRDMGHVDIVSASTIVSEKIPKRWDLPLIDPRRLFRHLEGPKTGSSISNLLSTKMGILTTLGIGGFFAFFGFFIITASGHLR